MVDTRKVKFARGYKNTAGFFTLLYVIAQLIYLGGAIWVFGDLVTVDGGVFYTMVFDIAAHLLLAIALFTATTPKWLWFPTGALAVFYSAVSYDFLTRFANNGYNLNIVTRLDLFSLCTAVGYLLLFIMLFAKGFAKSMWLVPAALLSVKSVLYALNEGKMLSDYFTFFENGEILIGTILTAPFLGDVMLVLSAFITCLYVGKYSKHRLLFKRFENRPSAPAAASPESPLASTASNGSVNVNSAPKTAPTAPVQPSSPSVNVDSKLGVKSDSKPAPTPSVADDTTVTLDDALAAEIESGLGGSTSDDPSSDEGDLASEIDKLMGN